MRAKLHAYDFWEESLLLKKSYLTCLWQRTNFKASFSNWNELLLGVARGSAPGPLLFNKYVNDDVFHAKVLTNVCNYADETTFHVCDSDICSLIQLLEHDSLLAIDYYLKVTT